MTQLKLTFFGGFEAAVAGERATQFRTDKMRALLAYLAMNEGRPFRRDILATLLWSEWSDANAKRNLRQSLHRIIQLLNKLSPSLGIDLFTTNRQTVQLNDGYVQLDVSEFRSLVQTAETHAHANLHSCRACLNQLQQAAALYKGDLLEGFTLKDAYPFEEWLFMEREQLQQQVLEVFGKLSSAYEWQEDYGKAQLYANRQVMMAPWRESAHRQLMRLYMLQGKRSNALAQYDTCVQLLAQELGVEPSPETVQLWEQIRDDAFEQTDTPVSTPSSFPTQLTPFVGRQADISQIIASMADDSCRLLTLIGPGGIGKTRLGIQVGQELAAGSNRYKDGAYFIPLVRVTDVPMLVNAIAQHLGIKLTEPISPKEQLLAYLQDKAMLLVCDNFEQVENGPAFLSEVIGQAPKVQLLVTSRESLGLQAEWRQVVNGLDFSQGEVSEAVLFFQRNARRVAPHFELNETNMTAVLDLCHLVDGMPLALEIAAAWTRMMDAETILQQTQRSLDFLTAPMEDFPDRHRSIQAVIAQSWQMLSGRLQKVLGQLAFFGGTFTLEAALGIVDGLSMLDMATLLDKSLLNWQPNGRYQMHELLRQFVHSQPIEEPAGFREAYGRYYLSFVAEQEQLLLGDNPPQAIEAMQRELGNIRLAWQWATEAGLVDLIAKSLDGLVAFYEFRGTYNEGRSQFKAAAEALPASVLVNRLRLAEASCLRRLGDLTGAAALVNGVIATEWPETRLQAMIALAKVNEQASEYDKAIAILQVALELAEPMSREAAQIWGILGLVYGYRGPMEERLKAHKQALAINVALADRLQTAECHNMLGMIYKDLGEYDEAIAHTNQALAIAEEMNHRESIGQFRHRMGVIYWRMGDIDQSKIWYEKSLTVATEINHKRLLSILFGGLGILAKRQRDYDEALRYYWRAIQLGKDLGDRSIQAVYMGNIGNVYLDLGQYDRAIEHLEQAAALDKAIGAMGGVARHQGNMGDAFRIQRRFAEALPYFEAAIEPLRETKALFFLCWVLVSYGECLFELGRLDEARAANEEGQQVAEEVGRDYYLLMSLLLEARLDAAEGGDVTKIGARVATFHDRFECDLDMTSEINLTLWQITGDSAVREIAVDGFRQLYEETRRERYRVRLDEGIS